MVLFPSNLKYVVGDDLLNDLLLYISAAIVALWGLMHLAVTKSVVDGFGEISPDNRWIILQEWIIEGVAMVFLAILLVYFTFTGVVDLVMYWLIAGALIIFAIITALTGARTAITPFKVCPVLLTISAVLIWVGTIL